MRIKESLYQQLLWSIWELNHAPGFQNDIEIHTAENYLRREYDWATAHQSYAFRQISPGGQQISALFNRDGVLVGWSSLSETTGSGEICDGDYEIIADMNGSIDYPNLEKPPWEEDSATLDPLSVYRFSMKTLWCRQYHDLLERLYNDL